MALRPSLLFRYGRLLTMLKRRSRALEVFRTVTREDPRHRQALALDPADAASNFNVAFVLQRLGQHDEAIPRFERARRGLEVSRAALKP